MSSDPTRPNPEWWQQQSPQGNQAYQGNQGSQETKRFAVNEGYSAGQGYQGPPRRTRRRRRKWPLVSLIVIILALVAVDRVACVVAENQMASQIQKDGFPTKPNVTIEGFPFLTQLAARDFKTVVISASNVTEGPLEIASLSATIHGMHINSGFSGATLDTINGSALITFAALAHAGGIPQGITLSADGSNRVKATVNLDIISATVVAEVTKTSPSSINVRVVEAGDVPTSLLGNLVDFNINIPKSDLPAGLTIQSVDVTQQGIRVTVVGHNTTLSQ